MKYVGIDVGGTNLVAGVVDENGHILDKVSHPVDKGMTADDMCIELASMARKVCGMSDIPEEEIAAVGVGLPGLVDNKTGVVGYQAWIEAFCKRKYNADFSKEMSRSVKQYCMEYLED